MMKSLRIWALIGLCWALPAQAAAPAAVEQSYQQVELARLVTRSYPGLERVRFTSSGTEAAQSVIRLARGPTLPDRVVAIDVMVASTVAGTALFAVAHGLPVLLDIAIILALVSFIGTVGIARYLEGGVDQ